MKTFSGDICILNLHAKILKKCFDWLSSLLKQYCKKRFRKKTNNFMILEDPKSNFLNKTLNLFFFLAFTKVFVYLRI